MSQPAVPAEFFAQVKKACTKYEHSDVLGRLPIASAALRAALAADPDHPTNQEGRAAALRTAIDACLKLMKQTDRNTPEGKTYICLFAALHKCDPFDTTRVWTNVAKGVHATHTITRSHYHTLRNKGIKQLSVLLSRYLAEETLLEPLPEPFSGFAGRQQEIAYYKRRLLRTRIVVIEGVGGIGKTMLAAQIARTSKRSVCWYVVRPGITDDQLVLLATWAAFLALHGDPYAWALLRSFTTTGDVSQRQLLSKDQLAQLVEVVCSRMGQASPLLCFDDVDLLPAESAWFWTLLERMHAEPNTRLLLTSCTRPPLSCIGHYEPLQGLSVDGVAELLKKQGITLSDTEIKQVHTITAGTPRLLELWLTLYDETDTTDQATALHQLAEDSVAVAAYLTTEVLARLTPGEHTVLYLMALPRRPIDRLLVQQETDETLLALDVDDADFTELERRGLLHKVGSEQWTLSPILRSHLQSQIPTPLAQAMHAFLARRYRMIGDLIESAFHQMQSDDPTGALLLIAEHATLLIDQGQAAALLGVLTAFPIERFDEAAHRLWHDLHTTLLLRLGRLTEAEQAAHTFAAEAATPYAQAHALQQTGAVWEVRGDMQQATAYYQRALALLEQGDAMREIWLRRDLAWTLEEQSHLRRSETEAYRAVAALERLLGAIAGSRQEFSAALYHYNVAAEIAQTHGFRVDLAAALNNRGRVYQQQERYAEAVTDLTEALRLYAEAGALEGQMNALLNLGVCAYEQQQYAQAIQYEMQALEHCRQQHNRGMELLVCSQLAEAYLALGQVDAARAASEQALQITLAEARLPEYAEAQRIYAEVLLACNEHVAALQQAHAAYDLLRPSLESDQAEGETMAYICETLAHVYMAYGDTAQAARYAAQATTLRDTNEAAPEA